MSSAKAKKAANEYAILMFSGKYVGGTETVPLTTIRLSGALRFASRGGAERYMEALATGHPGRFDTQWRIEEI